MSKSLALDAFARSRAKYTVFAMLGAASLSMLSMTAIAELAPPQQRVSFSDLDLTQERDTQTLYRRLRSAASEVCSDFRASQPARMRARRLECERRALSNAVAAIDHPALTALHWTNGVLKLAQGKSQSVPTS